MNFSPAMFFPDDADKFVFQLPKDGCQLVCPSCGHEFFEDEITEIYGFYCLNEECNVGDTLPDKIWYSGTKIHRVDGPAIECADGTKSWYINGERHRENGPAVEYPDGRKEWWIKGLPQDGFKRIISIPLVRRIYPQLLAKL